MKKGVKQQMYSKMYLITPMVYEKIKNQLDKSDLTSLTNINKPYFTPKIEIHGSSDFNNPPYNPGFNMPPPVQPYHPYLPSPPQSNPSSDLMRELSEMDWHEYLTPSTTEIATQTEEQPKFQTFQDVKTEVIPTSTQQIQTDPIFKTSQQTQSIETTSQDVQTDPILKKIMPTDDFIKNIIPTADISTQTPRSKIRKSKAPKKRNIPPPEEAVDIPMMDFFEGENQPSPSSTEIVPSHSREIVIKPSRQASTLKRKPLKIRITPEMMREYFHSHHYGQQLPPSQPSFVPQAQQQVPPSQLLQQVPLQLPYSQPKAITYVEQRSQPEQPLAIMQSRDVAVTEPTYYVQTSSNEPPGQRQLKREHVEGVEGGEGVYVHPSKIIKHTYVRKKKKKPTFTPTPIFNRELQDESAINLTPVQQKKVWSCDTCGALLSTKYNLIRHQQRERRRLGEQVGQTTDLAEKNPQDFDEFKAWTGKPIKRTSTYSKFKTPVYTKRVATEPTQAIQFKDWSQQK
jgi:hypothetical protein